MKNQFIITLLCLSLMGIVAMAQTKKPTTTRKPSTTVQSSVPKTTTTTIPKSTTAPVIVEEKKAMTTTTTSPNQSNSSNMNSNNSTGSTTIQQSSGPSKGSKKATDSKSESVREPKTEKVRNSSSLSDGKGFHFGIKAGANNLFFLSSNKINSGTPDFSVGFHGGLVGNFGLSKTVSIQAEALYVQQSVKFSDGADYLTATSSGVEIPLALQFNFGGNTKFFVNAGGYANYALSSNSKAFISGVSKSITDDYTGVSFGDRTDYGAILGLGVKFNQALFIEARANYSVKDGTYTDSAGKKVIPIFAGLSVGYFFN